ncbi:MAG: OmpH family outer membrane protein [Rhodospirillales bacterium]
MRQSMMRAGPFFAVAAVFAMAAFPAAHAQQQQRPPAQQPAPRPAPQAQPAAQPAPKPAAAAPAAGPAAGAPLIAPVVAVVDIDRIRESSNASKSVRDQLEKHRGAFQDEISKQENELRNAEQELNKQRTVLSPEAFNQRRLQFEQRVSEVQRQVQARRRQLESAMATSMTEVNRAVVDAVQEVATAHGANLVLPKSQIILVDKAMEVTEEVLVMVNKKLPAVKVTLPAAAAAPAR